MASRSTMSLAKREMENTLRTIFRRCVQCPNQTPLCPKCANDQVCKLVPLSCDACPATLCVKEDTFAPVVHHKKTPVGAIAGGVIGGVAVILLVTFLVWRFCIRNRRREFEEQRWSEYGSGVEKSRDRFTMNRDARASTHTVGSVASSVLTRASNVIQIAYIPGVTNRSPTDSPGVLVPPVPPLPLASISSSAASTPTMLQDQHFFMPGDLRDSTWSGLSDAESRKSITPSLARDLARESVATTAFRETIVQPTPAQTALRGKAAVVSVKSGASTPLAAESPRIGTPPLPSNEFSKGKGLANSDSPIVARSLSARSVQVVKKSPSQSTSTKVPTRMNSVENANEQPSLPPAIVRSPSSTDSVASHSRAKQYLANHRAESLSSDDEEDPHERSRRYLLERQRESVPITIIEDTPSIPQIPFADASRSATSTGSSSSVSPIVPARHPGRDNSTERSGPSHRHKKSSSLSELIQEATRRASRAPALGNYETIGGSTRKELSPFSDDNEVEDASKA